MFTCSEAIPKGIALIWQKRAIPLYWSLLPKLGNSNLPEQPSVYDKYYHYLKNIKLLFLGEREFCSTDLASWRCDNGCISLLEAEKKLGGDKEV